MAARLDWSGKSDAFALAENGKASALLCDEQKTEALALSLASQEPVVLVGDNLNGLHILANSGLQYHFIYIDPPYNSGQQFSYFDKHGSSLKNDLSEDAWLTMMTPRMILAKKILREDGVMFISIDEREVGALTLLLREIFGRENHIGTLKWKKKRKSSFLDKHLGNVIEYILIFAKDAKKFPRLLGEKSKDITRPVLNASNQIVERILPAGTTAKARDGKYSAGPRKNKTLEAEFLQDFEIRNGKLVSDVPVRGRFRISQDKLSQTVFITPKLGLRRHVLAEELARKHASDDCTNWPTNEDGEQELRKVFGERVFDYPKPAGMLCQLLDMCQFQPNEEILCLDFFAGSASLAEAVVLQNNKDGIQRSFTLIQNTEPNLTGSRFATIADLTIERSRVSLQNQNKMSNLKVYFIKEK